MSTKPNDDGEIENIEQLRDHPWVFDVRDVSMDGTKTFRVQFDTQSLPEQLLESDEFTVRNVWIGVVPQAYLRAFLPTEWLFKKGIGHSGIAAILEVTENTGNAQT